MKRKSILKDISSNYLKHTKSESGITLIALVVTIVVLLILAGVTISLVLGENGILTQAKKAKFKNEQSDVLEATQIYAGDYEIEKNTQATNGTIINYLNGKNIIDSNNIINVEALLKKKLSTGQGTENSDVYVIEQNSNKEYIVVYYDKEGNKTELGILGKGVEEVADENIFDIFDGEIYIKEEYGFYDEYVYGWENWTIENLVIPDTVNGEKVTQISYGFIGNNDKIKSITLPETVTSISSYAFSNCTSLENIKLPKELISIGIGAFYNCTSLQSIDIPEKVNYIGRAAFDGCTSLQRINIPKEVTNISGIFSQNLSLKEITVDENNPNYSSKDGVLFDKAGETLLLFPTCKEIDTYEIPVGTITITNDAFNTTKNQMLKRIIIPNTVTIVNRYAFSGGNSEQTIKVPFSSETTRPAGWDENWISQESFMGNIEYTK